MKALKPYSVELVRKLGTEACQRIIQSIDQEAQDSGHIHECYEGSKGEELLNIKRTVRIFVLDKVYHPRQGILIFSAYLAYLNPSNFM